MNSLLRDYDALGLAALVREKEIHPRELVELSIHAIERMNPSLNAVFHKMYEQARRQVETEELRGPLSGVPMLLKEVNQDVKGARPPSI